MIDMTKKRDLNTNLCTKRLCTQVQNYGNRNSNSIAPKSIVSMTVLSLYLFVISLGLFKIEGVEGQEQWGARCETGLTPQNRTIDNCDKKKYLLCRQSHCECLDVENQVWTYERAGTSPHTLLRYKRSRRGGFRPGTRGTSSTGASTGAKIAAGVAVGAAGGYLASNVINNLGQNNVNNVNPSWGQGDRHEDRRYSCYTRVGSQCRIDSPFQSGQITRIAKCVPFAKCVVSTQKNNDQRLGVCACKTGYSATDQDYCTEGASSMKLQLAVKYLCFLSISMSIVSTATSL